MFLFTNLLLVVSAIFKMTVSNGSLKNYSVRHFFFFSESWVTKQIDVFVRYFIKKKTVKNKILDGTAGVGHEREDVRFRGEEAKQPHLLRHPGDGGRGDGRHPRPQD